MAYGDSAIFAKPKLKAMILLMKLENTTAFFSEQHRFQFPAFALFFEGKFCIFIPQKKENHFQMPSFTSQQIQFRMHTEEEQRLKDFRYKCYND